MKHSTLKRIAGWLNANHADHADRIAGRLALAASPWGVLEVELRSLGVADPAELVEEFLGDEKSESLGFDLESGLPIARYAPPSVCVPVTIPGSPKVGDVVMYVTKGADATDKRKAVPAKRERRAVAVLIGTTKSGETLAVLAKA